MSQSLRRSLHRVVACALAFVASIATARAQYPISRVSFDSSGSQGDANSFNETGGRCVSHDGLQIAFSSDATNLVAGDTNGRRDVFVRDVSTGKTVRVSVDSSGGQGDWGSNKASISSDGRFVIFTSFADDLVPGDTNNAADVFRHDRDPDGNGVFDEGNGVTIRVNVDSSGAQANGASQYCCVSGDGNLVVFDSGASNLVANDTNGAVDVFLHDCTTGVTTWISNGGDNSSYDPWISTNGDVVAFTSLATNLVSGDTNHAEDLFVFDLTTQTTTRVSVDSAGNQASGRGPSPLSDDGSMVVFTSDATNLVAGDTNQTSDVFLHDLTTGVTTRESVDTGGVQFADFSSFASISGDGNVVAFERHIEWGCPPVPCKGDYRAFARDRAAGLTVELSLNCGGKEVIDAYYPAVSGDGRYVAFTSSASDLVAGDTNAWSDVFRYDRTIVEPDAAWSNYGSGFPGSFGIPTITLRADPVLGTKTTLDVGNSSSTTTPGFLLVGAASASLGTSRGGTLLVQWLAIDPIAVAPGGYSLSATLPLDPAWCGASAYLQAIELDAGAQFGLSFTPGLQATFGR